MNIFSRLLTLGFFLSTISLAQNSDSAALRLSGGGFLGFKSNLNSSAADTYGFDNTYMYLGARAQLPQNWNAVIRLDSETIGTVYATPNAGEASYTTSSLFFIRAFFVENTAAFTENARFRIGRHSTLYTESIESDISLRWLGDSLNRTSNYLYKSINGASYLLDKKTFKIGLQIHNGAETLVYKPDTDASLSSQFFSSFKIADDALKLHLGISLDTKSTSTAQAPINTVPLNGRSAWMMGATHKSNRIDASLEFGQLSIPTVTEGAFVYSAMTHFRIFQNSYGLYLRYFGSNTEASESVTNSVPKTKLTIAPTYQFSPAVKTALLYESETSATDLKTQAISLRFSTDF